MPITKINRGILEKAKRLVLIENNYKGHFGDFIKLELGIEFDEKILKYNGLPFNIEEVMERIEFRDMEKFTIAKNEDIAWCPECGNFTLLKIIQQALKELDLDPSQTVISSGIGQAAKMPQYIDLNFYNGLHGRGLPVALAIKMANPNLTVIAEGGDGDMYGEGGNHFLHSVRRNPNILHLVHDRQVYGLTKGQAHQQVL